MACASRSRASEIRVDLQSVFVRPEDATAAEGRNADAALGTNAGDRRKRTQRFTDQACRLGHIVIAVTRDLRRRDRSPGACRTG